MYKSWSWVMLRCWLDICYHINSNIRILPCLYLVPLWNWCDFKLQSKHTNHVWKSSDFSKMPMISQGYLQSVITSTNSAKTSKMQNSRQLLEISKNILASKSELTEYSQCVPGCCRKRISLAYSNCHISLCLILALSGMF